MRHFVIAAASCLKGTLELLGDKSISHRAVILSALSRGKTRIKNFPVNQDCLETVNAFKKLGVKIAVKKNPGEDWVASLIVSGKGLYGLKKPHRPIFIAGSGTTFRLLLGVLAGQEFSTTLIAGKPLSKRPMLRIAAPLRMMGASISPLTRELANSPTQEEYPPFAIKGGNLKAITYRMPVASAQVKSAILLAGLFAKGRTRVIEEIKTRDHTERMLVLFKSAIKIGEKQITLEGRRGIHSPNEIYIPADISSAAFFMVLAAITANSRIIIKNVSLNPTRSGIIQVLKRMQAKINIKNQAPGLKGEPMGNIEIKSSGLKGTRIKREEVPSLIDELPVLMVAACFAKGKTIFQGVGELRVKETDRIASMAQNLKAMAADIKICASKGSEDIVIKGTKGLKGTKVKSFGDHRTAMSMVVAGLAASGKTQIDDIECIHKSFPGFIDIIKGLT